MAVYAAEALGATISYSLPRDGRVSLLILDATGAVVREFLHAAPRKKGLQTETWDGLDDKGNAVPPGSYSFKGLLTQGLRSEYLLTVGTNPTPDWLRWPGNHRAVTGLACDESGLYAFEDGGEGTIMGLKMAWNGEERLWVVPQNWEAFCGMTSLASMNGRLYLLQRNQQLFAADASTGERQAQVSLVMADDVALSPFSEAGYITDLAAGAGQVVVSYARHGVVKWLDPGSLAVIDEAAVAEPWGVAVATDGRVLVISQHEVVSLTREDKKPRNVIPADRLHAPFRIDVDPTNGDILVAESRGARTSEFLEPTCPQIRKRDSADLGKNGEQIKRFSKSGQLKQALGREAGRSAGAYVAQDFRYVMDLAAAPDGGFVISEPDWPPRRTARFDKEGKLVREWYGGQRYANPGYLDPRDPAKIWINSAWSGVVHASIDYEKRSWTILETYQGLIGDVRHHDGGTYLCTTTGNPAVQRVVPGREWLHEVGGDEKGTFGASDHFTTEPFKNTWGSVSLGRNFDYLAFLSWEKVIRIPLRGWTADGRALYDLKEPRVVAEVPPAERPIGSSRGFNNFAEDEEGNIFAADNSGSVAPFGEGHWAAQTGANRVLKWDREGKFQWAVGRHAAGTETKPGEGRFFWGPVGTAKGCIAVRDVEHGFVHFWDKDGLWVGRFPEEPDLSRAPLEAYQVCGENFSGSLCVVPKSPDVPGLKPGEVLYVGSGWNSNPVFRLHGFDDFERFQGTLQVGPKAGSKPVARAAAGREESHACRLVHLGGFKADGDLGEWKNVEPYELRDGGEVRARIRLAWGPLDGRKEGILAAYEVITDAPWKNASNPRHAFMGGSAVDLRVGPAGPDRDEPIAGDVRYVAAPIGKDGSPVVVEFMPVAPRDLPRKARAPATYRTFNGTVAFQHVAADPEHRWAAMRARPDGPGWIVEFAAVPPPSLKLKAGARIKLDASVILGDAQGARSSFRLPLFSRSGEDKGVVDVYIDAQLRPRHWAEATLE